DPVAWRRSPQQRDLRRRSQRRLQRVPHVVRRRQRLRLLAEAAAVGLLAPSQRLLSAFYLLPSSALAARPFPHERSYVSSSSVRSPMRIRTISAAATTVAAVASTASANPR